MFINENYFLGLAKQLHRDCNMNAHTGAQLPTEGEGLGKDPVMVH